MSKVSRLINSTLRKIAKPFRPSSIKAQINQALHRAGYEFRRLKPDSGHADQLSAVLCSEEVDMVIDIGANEGQFAREIRQAGYTGKIISFEPLSSARRVLIDHASSDPHWLVHEQLALGDQEGAITINISGNSYSSSILPMLETHANAAIDSAYVDSETVPISKLDSVAAEYLEPGCNFFIKIDTQGFELQVLNGARETLPLAKGVLCELSLVPLYEGQALWREVIDRLNEEGFFLWILLPGFTDPRTGQSLQIDGIFLRKDAEERKTLIK